MPILPGIQHYITSEETEFEAPVSELTAQTIGEAINYLNDTILNNVQVFTTPGAYSVTVPTGISRIQVLGCGGGGGGAGSGFTIYGQCGGAGGSGGNGSKLNGLFIDVTPGDSLQVVIGAGGSGGAEGANGGAGGNTTISKNFVLQATFHGGAGGLVGATGPGGGGQSNNSSTVYQLFRHTLAGRGGNSGVGSFNPSLPGEGTLHDGGSGQPQGNGQLGGPGGGGGAGYGGRGGNGGPLAGAAQAGQGYGAGGGGGSGGYGGNPFPGSPGTGGANGAGGYLAIVWR